MASLGSRIGEYRRSRGHTQEQLAQEMGVSSQAVSKWENDISCPDISLLPQLSDFLGISIDMLIRGREPDVVKMQEPGSKPDFDRMALRLKVNTADGDVVRLNLPLPLLRVGLEMGVPVMESVQVGGNTTIKETMGQIDIGAIIKLAESGLIGKLLEVTSHDGDTVEIVIE